MNLVQHHRYLQSQINRFRRDNRLVIWWPDYEIYDLLNAGIPLEELGHYTSVPPLIHHIQTDPKDFDFPFHSKQYTHMAIFQRLELDEQLRKLDQVYLILTKRALAVNQITSRFINERYIVTVQVAQLNLQSWFWGVQVLTDKVSVLGPRYISRNRMTWYLDYQFDKPIKSLVFYSAKREIAYGKNHFYGTDLPKDVKRQFCMKFRKFKSYIESQINTEQKLLQQFKRQGLFKIGNLKNVLNQQVRTQSKDQEEFLIRMKHEKNLIDQQDHKQHPKSRKITISLLNQQSIFQIQSLQFTQSLQSLQQKINIIKLKAQDQIIQILASDEDKRYKQILQIQGGLQRIGNMYLEDQIFLIKRIAQLKLTVILDWTYTSAIIRFKNSLGSRENWLSLYEISIQANTQCLTTIAQQFLKMILVMNPVNLLKDSEQDIARFNKLPNCNLRECVLKSLQIHNNQCSTVSDLLYLLMQLQDKQNIFQLYQSYKLSASSLIIGQSINKWIQRNGYFHVLNSDVVYTIDKPISTTAYKFFQSATINTQITSQKSAKITLFLNRFTIKSFICSKKYQYEESLYQLFVFAEDSSITCMIQQFPSNFNQSYISNYRSFEINIQLTVNSESFSHTFSWCFAHPSVSVGYRFPINNTQESKIKCTVTLNKNIIHQSIMNYFGIRFSDMLALPKLQKQNNNTESNKKVSKRRSSILLEQSLTDQNSEESMDYACFFHYQCSNCKRFVNKQSIYQLSEMDMFTILKSASFSTQFHVFISLFKYLTINLGQQINQSILLSVLRRNYLSAKRILETVNSLKLSKLPCKMFKLITCVIDKKLQIMGGLSAQTQKAQVFEQQLCGRTFEQIWLYYQQDCSEQYLILLSNSQTV